jgi:Autotransporter beta-domain
LGLRKRTASSAEQHFSAAKGQAQSLSFTTAAAYRIPLPSNWFVEPSFGGVLSHSTLRISDINSVLGRASLRIGTSLTAGIFTWQPFLAATILHEFAGSVTSTQSVSATGGAGPDFDKAVFTTVTDRIGTYEQVGFGTAVAAGNTGWLGYGRGDVKFGENIQGWGVNFGLRYQW